MHYSSCDCFSVYPLLPPQVASLRRLLRALVDSVFVIGFARMEIVVSEKKKKKKSRNALLVLNILTNKAKNV